MPFEIKPIDILTEVYDPWKTPCDHYKNNEFVKKTDWCTYCIRMANKKRLANDDWDDDARTSRLENSRYGLYSPRRVNEPRCD